MPRMGARQGGRWSLPRVGQLEFSQQSLGGAELPAVWAR